MNVRGALMRRRAGLLLALFLCIEFLDELIDGLCGAAWPLIRSDLSLTYTEIGLLFSVPILISNIIEPPIGLLGDVWRRFVLIALGGLAYGTALMMFAGADGFITLMLAMVLLYPASGTFVSLSQSSLIDASEGDEERSMVVWTIAGSIGVAVGPLCLAGALAIGWSWRSVYAVAAVAAVILAAAMFLLRPNGDSSAAARPDVGEVLTEAWLAMKRRGVVRWLAVLAAVDLLLQTFVGFLALYLVDEAGASTTVAALGMTVWTVTALAGESALVLLLRRFDGLSIVRRSAPFVALFFAAFLLADGLMLKLALLGAIALGSAGWYSIVKAQFFRSMDGRTGTAMAVSSLFGPVQALVPALVGLLAETYGLETALWLVLLAPAAILIGIRAR